MRCTMINYKINLSSIKKIFQETKKVIKGLFLIYCSTKKGFHKEEIRLTNKYYTNSNKTIEIVRPSIIFMIDGRSIHGGLSDRLRGLCSIYEFCKKKQIPFYINAVYPFKLQDYLEPNIVKWQISPCQISYNPQNAIPICINDYQLPTIIHSLYLNKIAKIKKQIHIYSNTNFNDSYYSLNFNDLFQPSHKLQQAINNNLSKINQPYISIVFRFQQLLGDFKEVGYKILPHDKRIILINKCIEKVKEIHNIYYKDKQILVTSDSITFLNEINKLDFITIISGKVVHMDHTSDAPYEVYMKSFIDMFMLSKSEKILLFQTDDMYHSGFAKRAAMINNTPYEEIIF